MGAMAKITQAQVMIIAVVLTIIAGVIIFFTLIKPTQEAQAAADARVEAADTIIAKKPAAEADQKKALTEVAAAKRDWAVYDRKLMPNIDISNLLTGTQQLWHDQIEVLGPKVDKFLKADTSVRITQAALTLPAPSTDPNAVNKKSFTFPLGSVTVVGTFNKVLNHTVRWNKFDRLVLVDGLTLAGNSPQLSGSYSLTTFIFTHGDKAGTPIPQAAPALGGGFGGSTGGPPNIGGGDFGGSGAPPGLQD